MGVWVTVKTARWVAFWLVIVGALVVAWNLLLWDISHTIPGSVRAGYREWVRTFYCMHKRWPKDDAELDADVPSDQLLTAYRRYYGTHISFESRGPAALLTITARGRPPLAFTEAVPTDCSALLELRSSGSK